MHIGWPSIATLAEEGRERVRLTLLTLLSLLLAVCAVGLTLLVEKAFDREIRASVTQEVQSELAEIYEVIAESSQRVQQLGDTQVRSLHAVVPHVSIYPFCPICIQLGPDSPVERVPTVREYQPAPQDEMSLQEELESIVTLLRMHKTGLGIQLQSAMSIVHHAHDHEDPLGACSECEAIEKHQLTEYDYQRK